MGGIIDTVDMSLNKLWEIMKEHGSLACCSPWGHKELDMTEQLNNNKRLARIFIHHQLNGHEFEQTLGDSEG